MLWDLGGRKEGQEWNGWVMEKVTPSHSQGLGLEGRAVVVFRQAHCSFPSSQDWIMFIVPFPCHSKTSSPCLIWSTDSPDLAAVPQFPSLTKGNQRECVRYSVCPPIPPLRPSPPALLPSRPLLVGSLALWLLISPWEAPQDLEDERRMGWALIPLAHLPLGC